MDLSCRYSATSRPNNITFYRIRQLFCACFFCFFWFQLHMVFKSKYKYPSNWMKLAKKREGTPMVENVLRLNWAWPILTFKFDTNNPGKNNIFLPCPHGYSMSKNVTFYFNGRMVAQHSQYLPWHVAIFNKVVSSFWKKQLTASRTVVKPEADLLYIHTKKILCCHRNKNCQHMY